MVGMRSVAMVVGALLLGGMANADSLSATGSPSAPSPAAKNLPYDEAADASADVAAALKRAATEGKAVLLTFGANWCPDCRTLGTAMTTPPLRD